MDTPALIAVTAMLTWALVVWFLSARRKANAAGHYRRAFANLPGLTEEEASALFEEGWDKGRWTEPADRALNRLDRALALLQSGAAATECNWRFDVETVLGTTDFPHIAESRMLFYAAAARAARRFSLDEAGGAVDDCLAALLFARRFGAQGLMIHVLVGQAGETHAIRLLAENLVCLNASELCTLAGRLANLPPAKRHHETLAAEARYNAHFRRGVREAVRADGGDLALVELIGKLVPMPVGDQRKRVREAAGGTMHGLGRLFEEYVAFGEREFAVLTLPWTRFKPAAAALDQEAVQSKNPLLTDRPVTITRARLIEFVSDARAGMLRAAVAVLLDGSAKLGDHPDPAGGGPYALLRPDVTKPGFELRSKLMLDGRPVALRVGLPPENSGN